MAVPVKESVNTAVTAKPFLKWAGGKRQLLQHFIHLYPPQLKAGSIKQYIEPFLGSGAVFFDIVQRYQIGAACLCDVNHDLVLTYAAVQSRPDRLTDLLFQHQTKYLSLNKQQRLAYYYNQRDLFNQQTCTELRGSTVDQALEKAAQFIFLNRTCFNGLFRVNAKGAFNTPAGDYANPVICDEANLAAVSRLLGGVVIKQADFKQAVKEAEPGAFIYLDPPYRPLSATASFTGYSKSAFADPEQLQLAALYKRLGKKGIRLMLSNSDTGDMFFDELYQNFTIVRVPARRLINANASKRGYVNEIVVLNYPL